MWSGPRNLSTAMMRSFGARHDCLAMDEPFYAAYLAATGLAHPMRDEIISAGETDSAAVIQQCLAPPPVGKSMVYQKHMTHHMIDSIDTAWIGSVTNVFLIRHPGRVLASYAAKTEQVNADDIGFRKQAELFRLAKEESGQTPAVVDAHDVRSDPEGMLRALCSAIDIPFQSEMLKWQPGPKPEDGVWASHWYDAVWRSTGFAPPEVEAPPPLPDELAAIEAEVLPDYEFMQQFALCVQD